MWGGACAQVVTESLQYIDERRAHWDSIATIQQQQQDAADSVQADNSGASPKAGLPRGLGAVLDTSKSRYVVHNPCLSNI